MAKQFDYNPASYNTGFQPLNVPNSAATIEREYARLSNADAQRIAQLQRNTQVDIANAEQRANEFVELGKFSNTLLELGTTMLKQNQENKEINSTFDALFGGVEPTPAEQEEDNALEALDRSNADAAGRVEQASGNAFAGEVVRTETPVGRAVQGYRQERANLTQAQINYSPFMAAYLQSNRKITVDGQTISIREAVASGDPSLINAALASGRSQFFKEFGLAGYSRRRVVKALSGTITNADSQFLSGSVSAGIKAKREAAQAQLDGQSYEVGRTSTLDEISSSFQTLSQTAWSSGAYATRGEANEAVVKGMLNGMIARGDVGAIETLERTLKVPGQAGSELRTINPQMFDEAKAKAQKALEGRLDQQKKDIRNQMFQDLRGATTQQERDSIIERAASALEQQGEWEAARALRQDRDDLVVDGASDYNAAQLEQAIRSGEITNAQQIEEARLAGRITDADAKSLTSMLSTSRGAEKPKDATAASVADDFADRAERSLLEAFGLKKDAMGNTITRYSNPIMSAADSEIILGQARRDINILTNQLLETNPGLVNNPIELQRLLNKELQAWFTQNLMTEGGKFYIKDLQDVIKGTNGDLPVFTKEQRGRFDNLLNSPGVLSRPVVPQGSRGRPVDFSKNGFVDGIVLPSTRQAFNPLRGDRIFSDEDLQAELENFKKGGVSAKLQRTADALGMSPLALLQQQSASYGLPVVSTPPTSQGNASAPLTAVQGAQNLMARGFPVRGASWLSGNIQQESSWVSNRGAWDDVGAPAGGLVSWRAERLDAIQQRYGKPISQITTAQQLDYLVEELKNYPEADRIFRNPYATERQLIRASKQFWGFGEEGQRFTYARNTEAQLTGRNTPRAQQQSQSSSNGRRLAYRTGNVGPTSTGQHLDVKQVGGGRFDLTELDNFVEVDDKDHGTVSLSRLRHLTNNVGDSWDEHAARGSHGIDVGTYSGSNVYVKNGAQVVSSTPTQHGELTTIQLPNGKKFTFLHGYKA